LNLLKTKASRFIFGTGISLRLKVLNENKIGVGFTHTGIIGPSIGKGRIKAITKIKKE